MWVIAETADLPTKMVKIVVTDDQGRYVMPDLPKANYTVWVRGYGLIDSPKVTTAPGKIVNLTAVPAPNEAAAAEIYPPVYWLSMAKMPEASEFPGTGNDGNGINPNIKIQTQFLREFKTDGCFHCHAIGTKATRTLSPALGDFKNSEDAWLRRIQSGQASKDMVETIERFGTFRGAKMLADWTDRIAAGAAAGGEAAAPAGPGAQCRHYGVGLGGPEGLPPRRGRDRQAQSHHQRLRVALWGDREQHRFRADLRSGQERRDDGEAPGPRSEDPVGDQQRR